MTPVIFHEQQYLRQKGMYFVYALLLGLLAIFVYGIYQQLFLGKPFGDKPAPDSALITGALIPAVLIVLFWRAKLETRISADGLDYRWTPVIRNWRTIQWTDVQRLELLHYGFVGIGWRLTPMGTLLTAGGNTGLRLTLKSGRRIMIGTQNPEDLLRALDRLGLRVEMDNRRS